MAYEKEIQKLMEQYRWNLYDLADAYLDQKEELTNKIDELQKEIDEHSCE